MWVHELQGLHIAVYRQAAPDAELANGVACVSSVLRVTDFVSKALGRFASTGMISAICTSSRTRGRPRRCKIRERPVVSFSSSLLLTGHLLVVPCREEVGSSLTFRPCRCPSRRQRVLRFFCHGTEGLGKEVPVDSGPFRYRERLVFTMGGFKVGACVGNRHLSRGGLRDSWWHRMRCHVHCCSCMNSAGLSAPRAFTLLFLHKPLQSKNSWTDAA